MNLTDAIKSIIKPHEEDVLNPLTTIWGDNIDTSRILSEYVDQLVRCIFWMTRHKSYYEISGNKCYLFKQLSKRYIRFVRIYVLSEKSYFFVTISHKLCTFSYNVLAVSASLSTAYVRHNTI